MTDPRDKPSRGSDSAARTTARDVPFARDAGSDAEPVPAGQRGQQLPRDRAAELDPADVELAVLRPERLAEDPSTKQAGRRSPQRSASTPPDSVTPESPSTFAPQPAGRGAEPPGSGGRAVASGTLLSVGSVDPRGRTERLLETPRMFFSQAEAGAEVYFRPGAIPVVTVHPTIETETVKLSDSVDPRRARTLPRLDRAALAKLAEAEAVPVSEAPVVWSRPFNSDAEAEQREAESAPYLAGDGQIHASLSAFRTEPDPDFSLRGVATRPEPLAARKVAEPPISDAASAVPTHRDLPAHRLSSSAPAPASRTHAEHSASEPGSEGPRPTTASIAADEPRRRALLPSYLAFLGALALALLLGFWFTRAKDAKPQEQVSEPKLEASAAVAPLAPEPRTEPAPPRESAVNVSPRASLAPPAPPARAPVVRRAAPAEPRKTSTPNPPRETIF